MKLSADMFKQIVSSLRSDAAGAGGHENREEARVGLRSSLDIVPCNSPGKAAKAVTVRVRDMSVNGIGLMTAAPIDAEAEFVVGFVRDKAKPLAVRYKVRYCKQVAKGVYSVGASLHRFEDDADARVAMGALMGKVHAAKAEAEVKSEPADPNSAPQPLTPASAA